MIDVRIVCTHDAVKMAETLMRLLAAEGYQVRLTYGRQSTAELAVASEDNDAVILIWSLDAPAAMYMHEWAQEIEPVRLVELGRTGDIPRVDGRRASVIDFTSWRGERGGRQWNALIERLRSVQQTLAPKGPPPHRAILAMGLVSAAAVGGAVFMRVNDAFDTAQPAPQPVTVASATAAASDGVGGPLQSVEPASAEDLEVHFQRIRHAQIMEAPPDLALTPVGDMPDLHINRERSFLGRLNDLRVDITDTILGEPRDPR